MSFPNEPKPVAGKTAAEALSLAQALAFPSDFERLRQADVTLELDPERLLAAISPDFAPLVSWVKAVTPAEMKDLCLSAASAVLRISPAAEEAAAAEMSVTTEEARLVVRLFQKLRGLNPNEDFSRQVVELSDQLSVNRLHVEFLIRMLGVEADARHRAFNLGLAVASLSSPREPFTSEAQVSYTSLTSVPAVAGLFHLLDLLSDAVPLANRLLRDLLPTSMATTCASLNELASALDDVDVDAKDLFVLSRVLQLSCKYFGDLAGEAKLTMDRSNRLLISSAVLKFNEQGKTPTA
jgi:hypothetical protein